MLNNGGGNLNLSGTSAYALVTTGGQNNALLSLSGSAGGGIDYVAPPVSLLPPVSPTPATTPRTSPALST